MHNNLDIGIKNYLFKTQKKTKKIKNPDWVSIFASQGYIYYMHPIFTLSLHANSSIDFVSISE